MRITMSQKYLLFIVKTSNLFSHLFLCPHIGITCGVFISSVECELFTIYDAYMGVQKTIRNYRERRQFIGIPTCEPGVRTTPLNLTHRYANANKH